MKTQIKQYFHSAVRSLGILQIKKFLAALLLPVLFGGTPGGAQTMSGGIVAGVTSSDLKIDRSFENVMEGKNIYGFEGGLYLKPTFGPFYLKPQLLYDYRTGNVESISGESPAVSTRFNMHNLEVPMLFGFHILMPVYVEAGPVYNYILGVTKTYNNNNVDLNRNGFGYRIGAGVDLKVLLLHASYQGITYNASDSHTVFRDPDKLILGVSIPLGKTK